MKESFSFLKHRRFTLIGVITVVLVFLSVCSTPAQNTPWPDGCTIGAPLFVQFGLDKIFWGACDRHDLCYGQCNPQGGPYLGWGHKANCDLSLSAEMGAVCAVTAAVITFPLGDISDAPMFMEVCGGLAAGVMAAVSTEGIPFYKSDQCFRGCNQDMCVLPITTTWPACLAVSCIKDCGWSCGPTYCSTLTDSFVVDDPNCQPASPIVVDVTGDGYQLTDLAHGVAFNLTGQGRKMISWTDPRRGNAWLVLDRNGNGVIDDGTELFGNFTPQPSTPGVPPNGFLALAVYDLPENGGNGNDIIDPGDAVWSKLRLWIDSNQNGVSERWELHTLSEFDIDGIDLKYHRSNRKDQYGNLFRYRGDMIDRDGHKSRGRTIWDVFLIQQR